MDIELLCLQVPIGCDVEGSANSFGITRLELSLLFLKFHGSPEIQMTVALFLIKHGVQSLIDKSNSDNLNSWFPAPNGGILRLEVAILNFEGCGM